MTDKEKYDYVEGVGWGQGPDYYEITPGYYVGNIPGINRLEIPGINMQDAAQGTVRFL